MNSLEADKLYANRIKRTNAEVRFARQIGNEVMLADALARVKRLLKARNEMAQREAR